MPEKLSETEARQGRRGVPVLVILIAALVLAAIIWVAVELHASVTMPEAPDAGDLRAPSVEQGSAG
jgi:hypothetical protein